MSRADNITWLRAFDCDAKLLREGHTVRIWLLERDAEIEIAGSSRPFFYEASLIRTFADRGELETLLEATREARVLGQLTRLEYLAARALLRALLKEMK